MRSKPELLESRFSRTRIYLDSSRVPYLIRLQ